MRCFGDERKILPTGLAISPKQAAECAEDKIRTERFINAVEIVSGHFERPRIIYAGCGPLAPLVEKVLSNRDASVLLIDVFPENIESAQEALAGSMASLDFICADASEVQVDSADIILSETMGNALFDEPMVSVMRNLSSQCPEAALIPNRVEVNAWLMDRALEYDTYFDGVFESDRVYLGEVFALDKKSISRWAGLKHRLPGGAITLPESDKDLCLLTDIEVCEGVYLMDYECALTTPRILTKITPGVLNFEYELSENPKLIWH